jgi:hypothetical protein
MKVIKFYILPHSLEYKKKFHTNKAIIWESLYGV